MKLEINYKKYRNFKTFSTDEHFEYLFYVEKKDEKDVEFYCPLNYMGGKTNVIEHIKPVLNGKTKFIDEKFAAVYEQNHTKYLKQKVVNGKLEVKPDGRIKIERQ